MQKDEESFGYFERYSNVKAKFLFKTVDILRIKN